MGKMIAALRVLDRFFFATIVVAACSALALAAVLAFTQVILRFVFAAPVSWTDAAAQMLIVWMVHVGVALTMRTGALVSIDFLARALGGRPRILLEVCIALATLSFLGNLVWYGLEMVQRAQVQNHPALGISMAWGYAAVPVGAAFSIVALCARLLDRVASEEHTEHQA
jgi:C4-dicarboxylate transporter, DctQ subunit